MLVPFFYLIALIVLGTIKANKHYRKFPATTPPRQRRIEARPGLRVMAVEERTHRSELLTARNIDTALAEVEMHARQHGRGWRYRIESSIAASEFEPILLDNTDLRP